MPIRLATAAPRARPAARVTASAVSSPACGRGGQLGECLGLEARGGGVAQDRRGAGDGLEATEAAAVALGAVGFDDDMADLAGTVAVAAEQLAVEDEAGADAAPDLDRDQVVGPLVATEQEGREGRGTAVVGDDRGELVVGGEERAERQVGPGQVDRPADRAAFVDDARGADPDAEDRLVRAGQDLVDEVVDQGDRRVAVLAVEVLC